MYWGQMAVALAAAVGVGSYLYTRGHPILVVLLVAIIVYIGIRWLIAWGYRVRYWYRWGTKGHYSTSCPDCGQYIYRRQRDWILQCGRCGWTAGWPLVRWFTQSVPARQLRRTVVGPQLVVVVLAVSVLSIGGIAEDVSSDSSDIETSVPNSSIFAGNDPENVGSADSGTDQEGEATPTSILDNNRGIDTELAEQLILKRTNTVRNTHRLSKLSEGGAPTRFAEQHSQDMGEYDFFGHQGPNGTSALERMRQIGDACGGPASENAHRSPLVSDVRIYGSEQEVNIFEEDELAKYAVQGWMNSPGHRENMLDSRWSQAGVGVYVGDETVYMTIVFC